MNRPTGEQFELVGTTGGRRSRAIITEVAAGLRALEIDGVAVTETYPETSLPPGGAGIVLVPWPNRVRDGVWHLHGAEQQLDLTEPGRGNATHGLLRNTAYRVAERAEDRITLAATVFPQHGYPFQLDTTVTYALDAAGLTVTHTIENLSDAAAPVAVGAHPYLRVGDVPVEELVLTIEAATRFEVDEKLVPVAEHPVAGTEYDLSGGVRLGDTELNDAFGGVTDGSAHRLTAPDGRHVELWRDPDFSYVQAYTNREFPRGGELGLAVAIEPMTAPAGALENGQGLRWLEAGERWSLAWGIRYSG
jgi:aldose 1-epimerase